MTKRGYTFITYTADFSTIMLAADNVNLGSTGNIYPSSVYIKNFRFSQGFDVFAGTSSDLVNCINNCLLGVKTLITTDTDFCLICDSTTKLDADNSCITGNCMANYYPVNYLVSLNYCAYCLPSSYYVSIANTCIAAVCGNGFKEASE